jgi:hypothetical protein
MIPASKSMLCGQWNGGQLRKVKGSK